MGTRAVLAGVEVGDAAPVAVIGALNLSPESFYAGSVFVERDPLLKAAACMVEAGARFLDVGGMSSAPYLPTRVSEAEEADRLATAIDWLLAELDVPVSADTWRARPARAALDAGAEIINDVSGLTGDPAMAPLVAGRGAGVILMANERERGDGKDRPIDRVLRCLAESLDLAGMAGIPFERIAVDPGIGFFRASGIPWYEWDCQVLGQLPRLASLGRPICVGVSRKSFIGALLGQPDPADRLPGTVAAAAVATFTGAHLIRAHDVAETCQAARIAEAVRRHGEIR